MDIIKPVDPLFICGSRKQQRAEWARISKNLKPEVPFYTEVNFPGCSQLLRNNELQFYWLLTPTKPGNHHFFVIETFTHTRTQKKKDSTENCGWRHRKTFSMTN
jgi:hypothetical protein